MKICIKCKQTFTPLIKSRIICDACIDLRDNPPPPVVKPKKRKKRRIKRKPYNKRTNCIVCSRPFNTRNNNGKLYPIRIKGKYCTKLCCDFDKTKNKKFKLNYNISPKIKTPISCKLCGKLCIRLPQHLRLIHNLSLKQYESAH